MSKYGNKKVKADGMTFDSKAEYGRYLDLKLMQNAGVIWGLEHHTRIPLVVNRVRIGYYEADFTYCTGDGTVVEDVKSPATRKLAVYRLKRKLVAAIHGIDIQEVMA